MLFGLLPWVASVLIGAALDLSGMARWEWLHNWPLLVLPYPIAVFVAIYRYKLFDIELVVRRSLLYGALTSTLLLLFYGALGAGGALFSHFVGGSRDSVWVISGATLLLGLLFAPLRVSLQRLVDRRFFPERTAVRQRLIDLASDLPALGKLPLMGQHLVGRLPEIFAVRSATLLLATPETGHLVTLASTAFDLEEQFDQSFLLAPDDAGIEMLRLSGRPLTANLPAARSATMAQRLRRLGAELAVPLISRSRWWGCCCSARRRTEGRSPPRSWSCSRCSGTTWRRCSRTRGCSSRQPTRGSPGCCGARRSSSSSTASCSGRCATGGHSPSRSPTSTISSRSTTSSVTWWAT